MNRSFFVAGLAGVVLASTLASGVSLADDAAPTEPLKSHPIQSVEYNNKTGELVIGNEDEMPLTTEKVTHNARHKEIVFFIPNTTIQPTPKVVEVKEDPIVKDIRLEQRALYGIPAVRAQVELYTNSPFVPFSLVPSTPGLKMTFSRDAVQPQTMATTQKSQPAPIVLRGQGPSQQNQTLTLSPTTANNFMSFKTSDPDVIEPRQSTTDAQLASVGGNLSDSVLGPVSQEAFSIIKDIYFDENSLNIVSEKLPITVKRSFVLTEPNRYVVDISPAVLGSKSLTRIIPQTNPDILNLKAGQFDENTVRIVAQFVKNVPSVDLSRWEENRVLKLTF